MRDGETDFTRAVEASRNEAGTHGYTTRQIIALPCTSTRTRCPPDQLGRIGAICIAAPSSPHMMILLLRLLLLLLLLVTTSLLLHFLLPIRLTHGFRNASRRLNVAGVV